MLLLLLLAGSVTAMGQTTVTDELTVTSLGLSGSYSEKEQIGESGAVYSVYAMKSQTKGAIQINKKDNKASLTSTTSGGKVKSVSVVVGSQWTSAKNIITVYGSNTAYASSSDAYSSKGDELGKITNKATTLEVSGEYKYLCFIANGVCYLDKISIEWEAEAGTTPAPSISPESKNFMEPFTATISAAEGASIYYTTNGETPTAESTLYTEDGVLISGAADVTLKAIAVKDGASSDVTEETYKFVVETPTVSPESKSFTESLDVTVQAPTTENTEVYYTLDGSDPTTDGTAIAQGADDATETVTATTTVKAATKYTVDGTAHWSETVTYTYTLVQGSDDTKDGTVIWSESFDGMNAGTTPSNMTNDNATYNASSTGTKTYSEKLAGGTSPELLLSKNNQTLTINIKSLKGKSGELMLSFLSNRTTFDVTATGAAVEKKVCESGKPIQYAITVPEGTETLTLVIKNTGSNARVDNFMLAAQGTAKVTSAGYATLYTDKAFIMPEGLTGQTVTAASSQLTVKESYAAGSVVPAQTPLILKGDAADYNFTVVATDAAAPAGNLLHGTLADATTDYTEDGKTFLYYKLAYNNAGDKLGFYWAAAEGAAFTNAAGKAYLAVEKPEAGTSAVSGFAFEDVVSGIANAADKDAQASGAFRAYDMSGRLVQAASMSQLRSGLYIVNGKKLIIK